VPSRTRDTGVPGPRRVEAAPAGATGAAPAGLPIVVDGLTKTYGATAAVQDLSFTARPGRITGFLGPNGAGKTTTLRILVGLARSTAGTATFGGTAYADLPQPQRRVGCVLEPSFHPGRTGRNHLRVLAATTGLGDDRVDPLLALVGLTEAARRPAGGYSLGMRQRLALAGALLGDPDHLILDEPANGLDPEGIRWLRSFLRSFAAQGRTVLVSSHLLGEVQATVDDIVVINGGRLLRQTSMAGLDMDHAASRVRVSDPAAAHAALTALGLTVHLLRDDQGDLLRVQSGDLTQIGTALFRAGVPVLELARVHQDLEQQFFAMMEADR